jgi:hypothetical protein
MTYSLSILFWIIIAAAIAVIIILLVFGFAYGQNATNDMIYGGKNLENGTNWICGYINTKTVIENLRDCYRD